ncbi:MAG: GTP-dependent dephospho-CoA kinase family protein [Candidatus Micrarchaeia archaeon]
MPSKTSARPFQRDLVLPEELRGEARKPLGACRALKKRPAFLVAVGDETSRKLARFAPDVSVFDAKIRRRPVAPFTKTPDFRTANPAGTISSRAVRVLKKAFASAPATVFVRGEEDLLALPCILLSPDNAIVAYGQPLKGMILVRATPAKKKRVRALLASFDFA